MPFLASEPGGRWWTFTQTRYHTALCCPARATILTGQTSWHNGQFGNSIMQLNESETLATALQRRGYVTGLFGKYLNPYSGPQIPPGWTRWVAHKSLPSYYNFDVIDQGSEYTVPKTDDESYDAYWFANKLTQWTTTQNGPWFAMFTPYAPHEPGGYTSDVTGAEFSVPPRLPNWQEGCAKTGVTDPDISDKPTFVKDNPCNGGRNSGLKALVSLDHAIRRIYNALVASGQLDNTIIVFMGDNGMGFGSHRITGKSCAYEECLTNPLMVRVPDMTGGVINRAVSNLDLMPTVLELTGATTTLPQDGSSVVPLLVGDTGGWRDETYHHNGDPQRPEVDDFDAVRQDCVVHTPCYTYIEYHNGERELYDLTADPFQLTNLLPNPVTGYAGVSGWDDTNPIVQQLTASLATHRANGS